MNYVLQPPIFQNGCQIYYNLIMLKIKYFKLKAKCLGKITTNFKH